MAWKKWANHIIENDQTIIEKNDELIFEEQYVDVNHQSFFLTVHKKLYFNSMNHCVGILCQCTEINDKVSSPMNPATLQLLIEQVQLVTGHKPDKNKSFLFYTESMRYYLENIINSMPGNVFWMSTSSTFLGCNDNVLKLMGLSREDYIGKNYDDLVKMGIWTTAQVNSFKADDKQVVLTGMPILDKEEPPLPSPDGGLIYYITSRVPIKNKEQKVIGIVGISIDITERKKMEKALEKAKEEVEAANYIMTELIANLGHDLATPISDLGSIAQMLYLYADEYPELKEFIEELVKRCDDCVNIRQRFIDATSVAKLDVKVERFSIPVELLKLEKELKPLIGSKKLKLTIHPLKPLKENFIETDCEKFSTVLRELISNGIQFTNEGEVSVTLVKNNGYFIIEVTDTGIGIPSDKFEFIFKQYTKLSRSNKYGAAFKGVGAGLYLVTILVNILGGAISVKSDVGKGSTFTFSIPERFSNK